MAEDDGKIYIMISNRRLGAGGQQPGSPNQLPAEKSDNLVLRYAGHEFMHMIRTNAVKAVNYTMQNYGNFTGDYQTQRQLEDAKNMANGIVGYGMAFATGLGASGGNIAGGLVAVGAKAALDIGNIVGNQISIQMSLNAQNYSISQLRQLSGLNTLKDGSRGTLD